MPSLGRKIWKWFAALVAALLILLAIGVGLFRLAVPLVPELRADAEAMAERALGWPVSIGQIDLRWSWPGPELVLTDVQLLAPDTQDAVVTAARLNIAFGPLDFFRRDMRPSRIRLYEPTLALERDTQGNLVLSGYALPAATNAQLDWRRLLDMTLRHGRFTIIDGELHYRELGRDIQGWTLLLPEVSLESDGQHHELTGNVLPPGALGEQLSFRFAAEGQASRPEAWQWSLNLAARELRLAWWYQQIPWTRDERSAGRLQGTLDLLASVDGEGLEKWAGYGRISVDDLGLVPTRPVMGEQPAHFERIAFEWRGEREGGNFQFELDGMEQVRDGRSSRDGSLAIGHSDGRLPYAVSARNLPLDDLRALLRFLPVESADQGLGRVQSVVLQLAPEGRVDRLRLDVDPAAEPVAFQVRGAFTDIGFAHWEGIPGMSGLTGSIEGSHESGRLTLASRNVRIDTGDLFRTRLPAERLEGILRWEQQEAGWRIQGDELRVENPEVQANARLALDLPRDGVPQIDLAAVALNADFHARSTWLPVGIMAEPLVDWLDNAVAAGHAPEARLVLRGPLRNFPYRDGSGVFDIRFRVEDAIVEYLEGWPRIEQISADVHFHNESLDVRVDHARVMDALQVDSGQARFEDLQDGELDVTAEVHGDTADAWSFLRASPLAEPLAGLLDSLEVNGPLRADLNLRVPLKDADALRMNVDAELQGVTAKPAALPWTAKGIEGSVRVSERDVRAENLSGTFHGNPLGIDIAPVSGAQAGNEAFAGSIIQLRGRSGVGEFSDYLPEAWLARLEGAFDWFGSIRVPGRGEQVTIALASSLEGVDSGLPQPLNDSREVQAWLTLPGNGRIDADVLMQELGIARIRFVESPDGWNFDRGRLLLGATDGGPLPSESGLSIVGRVPDLDVGGWLELDDDAETAAVPLLRRFDIHAENLRMAGFTVADQAVRGTRRGGGWELALEGPGHGTLFVPVARENNTAGGRPMQVRLQRLHLPMPRQADDPDPPAPPNPRELPGVVLDIRDLVVGPVHLGHVSGTLERTNIGYTSSDLRARGSSFEIHVDGRWEYVEQKHYTSINTTLESRDLANTLSRLGYTAAIGAREARMESTLAWRDAPMRFDPGVLEGNVGVVIRDGSLREVSPGAGRLLGLLSITALPRRLMLDFSDFLGEGLHFDELSGDFVLTEGNAYTTNVQLQGPALSAVLVGRTGLVARDYDQLAIINPGVSASIPVAGYLAAGPQVGAALLLLSQLLKAPLSDITQVKYRITGSWDDPVIERVIQERNAREQPAVQ